MKAIETMARAHAEANYPGVWDMYPESVKELCIDYMRAAIRVLMECEMTYAMYKEYQDVISREGTTPDDAFKAMLAALLEET